MKAGHRARITAYTGAGATVGARLRARCQELELAVEAHARAVVADPLVEEDLEYAAVFRAAIVELVACVLDGLERGGSSLDFIGPASGRLARHAARGGVGLDVVLRRYVASNSLLEGFVVEAADELSGSSAQRLLSTQATLLDGLMDATTREYEHELTRIAGSSEQRLADAVLSILRGADAATSEVDYRFDAWHLGVIATGAGADAAIRRVAAKLERELLLIRRGCTTWAWFGGQSCTGFAKLQACHDLIAESDVRLAVGEPGHGIRGWRLTHRQAQSAARLAARKPAALTRYAGAMLVTAALGDDTLARSLEATYVTPLDRQREGGALLRETLLTYFEVGCNAATAAARLAVDRHTVKRRINKVEEVLGRPLHTCRAELEVALSLEAIGSERDLADRPEVRIAQRPAR